MVKCIKIFLFLVSAGSAVFSYAQAKAGFCQRIKLVEQVLETNHCSPRERNEAFDTDLRNRFYLELDPRHCYLTKEDIRGLSNDVSGCEFLEKATLLYKAGLKRSDSIVSQVLLKPFDFSQTESIRYPMDSAGFAENVKDLQRYWYKDLKLQTLSFLADAAVLDSAASKQSILKLEPAMRDKVKVCERRKMNKILQNPEGFESYVATAYCNALAHSYDPHSDYMPATEKENFDNSLSGQAYSFGIDLDENEQGEVVISHLVPGGAAWKSGELNSEDVLLQLKWKNKAVVDLTGADLSEVEDLLSKSNHDEMQLTVKKPGGLQKTVTLSKEKVKDEESIVKSFVLHGDKKLGYINLPGFYTQWEDHSGSSCANDVAREIVKMKKEKIDGLILDMRFNGGGSLQEALELAGIFIDEGGVCFVKGRDGKAVLMRDPNRGTIYDGPLLLLVNGQSASATEIVTGALQDYNRAIVVGSATYGKATGQIVVLADGTEDRKKKSRKDGSNGYVKVTIEKIYRPTGKTNQCKGVCPDIVFPDMYEGMSFREVTNSSALKPDSVKRALYFSPLDPLPVQELKRKSKLRTASNPSFLAVKKISDKVEEYSGQKRISIPMNYEGFIAYGKKEHQEYDGLEKQMYRQDSSLFKVENNKFDSAAIAADSTTISINENWKKIIMNSAYIHESYRILNDYLNLK